MFCYMFGYQRLPFRQQLHSVSCNWSKSDLVSKQVTGYWLALFLLAEIKTVKKQVEDFSQMLKVSQEAVDGEICLALEIFFQNARG